MDFGIMASIGLFLLGVIQGLMMYNLKNLTADVKDSEEHLSSLREEIPKEYVSKGDYRIDLHNNNQKLDKIYDKLDKIYDKIEAKADK